MRLQGKSVLVTGGTGMIGQAVVRHLVDENCHVATLSRRGVRPGNPDESTVAAHKGDINDPASLDFTDFDLVVHGAAFVGFGLGRKKQEILMHTNVQGTANVLDAAARDGVDRVLHVSSVAAIGETDGVPRDESWVWQRPEVFSSAYEHSKYLAHRLALSRDDVDVVSIMPSIVLGLGDSSSGLLLKRYLAGTFPAIVDHPGRLSFVHVEDVADAAVLALRKGKGAYVVNQEGMSLPELFDRFEAATGVPQPKRRVPFWTLRAAALFDPLLSAFGVAPLVSRDFVRSLARETNFDATRTRKELGWKPDMDAHFAADARRFLQMKDA